MIEVPTIGASEFARWRADGPPHIVLDVRRDDEVRQAAIGGSLHIPMHEIQARLGDVPRGKPIVVLCHLGDRSARVARFLIAAGMNDVYNLEGGIDAYSRGVDPTIPRY